MTKEEALNVLIRDSDTNKISDGYHTFGELYEHRIQLFIQLCKRLSSLPGDFIAPANSEIWRSRFHSDGNIAFGGGWFVLGIGKKKGYQITYHLPDTDKYWDQCEFAETLAQAPEFDGHTPSDVLLRLQNL
jgi:hypothetical protein